MVHKVIETESYQPLKTHTRWLRAKPNNLLTMRYDDSRLLIFAHYSLVAMQIFLSGNCCHTRLARFSGRKKWRHASIAFAVSYGSVSEFGAIIHNVADLRWEHTKWEETQRRKQSLYMVGKPGILGVSAIRWYPHKVINILKRLIWRKLQDIKILDRPTFTSGMYCPCFSSPWPLMVRPQSACIMRCGCTVHAHAYAWFFFISTRTHEI